MAALADYPRDDVRTRFHLLPDGPAHRPDTAGRFLELARVHGLDGGPMADNRLIFLLSTPLTRTGALGVLAAAALGALAPVAAAGPRPPAMVNSAFAERELGLPPVTGETLVVSAPGPPPRRWPPPGADRPAAGDAPSPAARRTPVRRLRRAAARRVFLHRARGGDLPAPGTVADLVLVVLARDLPQLPDRELAAALSRGGGTAALAAAGAYRPRHADRLRSCRILGIPRWRRHPGLIAGQALPAALPAALLVRGHLELVARYRQPFLAPSHDMHLPLAADPPKILVAAGLGLLGPILLTGGAALRRRSPRTP
ncbi:hypothetical protein [Corynebacterium sphenisci]|uniref:hypothetical protein n=1 Tax=Corynebacterium sphenisci TaxID=191493 RepID=UPI0026DEC367|nr:hypothetical protein [Corynebacterium sphenisci]MDO5730548.1 hypothetical protein [Corynebacterium sphenisci]